MKTRYSFLKTSFAQKCNAVIFVAALIVLSSAMTATPAYALTLPAGFCHTFNTNLQTGSTGPDVTALQLILASSGFLPSSSIGATKYDSKLASAVTDFQIKYKSEILTPSKLTKGTGTVGPATRKKLNQLYNCSNQTASIIDSFPTPSPTPAPTATPLPPIQIINASASSPQPLRRNDSGQTTSASVTLHFNIVNRNDDPLFINKNPTLAFSTITNLDNLSGAIISFISRATVSINPQNSYYVAPHTNRPFDLSVIMTNPGGIEPSINAFVKVNRIFYSTTTENASSIYEEKAVFTNDISTGYVTLGSE